MRWAPVSEHMNSDRSRLERANEVRIRVDVRKTFARSPQEGVATVLCAFPKELDGQLIYFFY